MKNLLLIVAFTMLLTSCQKSVKDGLTSLVTYMDKNCDKRESYNPVSGKLELHYECGQLWNVEALTPYCSQMNVCVEIVQGKFWADVKCDSLQNPFQLLKNVKPVK